jgi:hypothetical protein
MADHLVVDGNLGASYMDFANPGFFGKMQASLSTRFGYFCSCAGQAIGKGKILLFGDSTIFSNFAMHHPQNAQLMFNMMQYLVSPVCYDYARKAICVSLVFCIPAFSIAVIKSRSNGLATAVLVLSVFAYLGGAQAAAIVSPPKAVSLVPRSDVVVFDRGVSDFELPPYRFAIIGDATKWYDTFYTWTQRAGLIPHVVSSTTEGIELGSTLIWICPNAQSVSHSSIAAAKEGIRNGTTVVVVSSDEETVRPVLEMLGVPFGDGWRQVSSHIKAYTGCRVLLALQDFSTQAMGHIDDIPSADQREIWEEAYLLFNLATQAGW